MRFEDGDILSMTLWWKRYCFQAARGVTLEIPIWLLRCSPRTASYLLQLGTDLETAMGVKWETSTLSPRTKGILRRMVNRGLCVKSLSDLGEWLTPGRQKGIGPVTESDILNTIRAVIEKAAPKPTMETRLPYHAFLEQVGTVLTGETRH